MQEQNIERQNEPIKQQTPKPNQTNSPQSQSKPKTEEKSGVLGPLQLTFLKYLCQSGA